MTGTTLAEQLAPVKAAILAAARRDADRCRTDADEAARQVLAGAAQRAERLLGAARTEGAADAATILAAARARSVHEARAIVLAARHDVYVALRTAARTAAATLGEDPAVRRRMAEIVRSQLGPEAALQALPDGVAGQAHGRRVRCSLLLLADRAVDEVAAEDAP